MVINLLHEQPLNAYLTDIVYQGESVPKQQSYSGEFESPDYVEQHRDEIIKGILNQYIKLRIRNHLKLMETEPAFVLVDKNRTDLPSWTETTFARGENIYEFDGSKMSQKLRDEITMVRDFLYDEAGQYIDKVIRIARETKKKPRIRYDYLKTSNEYDSFEKALSAAKHWHDNIETELVKRNRNRELLSKSLNGAKHVMDLSGGFSVYQLTTEQALDFESEYMGHCVGKGSYDYGVQKGSIQIYSIRDEHGEPHATFEVRDGKIEQCKGKANKRPVSKYIPVIQEFIQKQGLEIHNDSMNMGFLKADNKYYNIYSLPKEMEVEGDINLSLSGLEELPDLTKWKIKGNFLCVGNKLTNLRGAPQSVGGIFNCSENELITLQGAPQNVGGYFACVNNLLTNLEGAPQTVGGNFNCSNNRQLTSLKGAPQSVGGNFDCSNNQLTSLEGFPKHIGGEFKCYKNKLTSLHGAPEYFDSDFDCSENELTNLEGAPREVKGTFNCITNQLISLNGAPKFVGDNFFCADNKLVDLKGAPERVEGAFSCSCNPLFSLEGLPKYIGCDVEIGHKDGSLPFMGPEYIMDMDFMLFPSENSLSEEKKQQMVNNWTDAVAGNKKAKIKQAILKLKKKIKDLIDFKSSKNIQND